MFLGQSIYNLKLLGSHLKLYCKWSIGEITAFYSHDKNWQAGTLSIICSLLSQRNNYNMVFFPTRFLMFLLFLVNYSQFLLISVLTVLQKNCFSL